MTNAPNPSSLAFRVRDAQLKYYPNDDFYIRPDGVLVEHESDYDHWNFRELTELLPSGEPRYVVERCTGYKDSEMRRR